MSVNNSSETTSDLPVITDKSDINDTYLFYGYPVVIPLAILMVIIIILALGGNVMVILTILRHRGMRTRTNMFIVNLAVADILVAAIDMPVSLVTILEGDWVFGNTLCQINAFTMALFLISSIHTLMYISIHKYISITKPFSRAMTPTRIKIMIFASWLWAAGCATGPLIGMNVNVYKKGASQCGPDIPYEIKGRIHSVIITGFNYIIPVCVMIFCYANIFREIHIHLKRIRQTSNIDIENSVQQQKKVAMTLFLVLTCFLLCWTPYLIYSNLAVFSKSGVNPIMNPLGYWFGYANSACNPIIYAFRSPSFRKGYKEIMCGPSSLTSGVNSLSFRSRSARGSQKSNCNVNMGNSVRTSDSHEKLQRQRTLLAQTSWRSLPLMPTLIRTFSKEVQEKEPDSPVASSQCGICGIFRSRSSSHEVDKTNDPISHVENNSHCLRDIPEVDEKDCDEILNDCKNFKEDSV